MDIKQVLLLWFIDFLIKKSLAVVLNLCQISNLQLIIKFNKGIRFLLCIIDSFSKYAWVVPVKD